MTFELSLCDFVDLLAGRLLEEAGLYRGVFTKYHYGKHCKEACLSLRCVVQQHRVEARGKYKQNTTLMNGIKTVVSRSLLFNASANQDKTWGGGTQCLCWERGGVRRQTSLETPTFEGVYILPVLSGNLT